MSVDGSPTNVKAEMLPQKIGFVGSGKMALALAKGFMAEGLVSPSQVNLSTHLFASLLVQPLSQGNFQSTGSNLTNDTLVERGGSCGST